MQVEQTLLMRGFRSVPDGLANYHWPKTVLHGIHRSGPHAAACGATGDDHGVHPTRDQPGKQVSPKEARCVFLRQQCIAGTEMQARIELDRLGACAQCLGTALLQCPDTRVRQISMVV